MYAIYPAAGGDKHTPSVLMIYLRGPGSARPQAVPCVKTFSSLSAFRPPEEKNQVDCGFVFRFG